jgi:hypothetical protein
MKEYYLYKSILNLVKDPITALIVYGVLYKDHPIPVLEKGEVVNEVKRQVVSVDEQSKKKELEESLKYLNSKSVKTKKDRESIGMIQAVLNNMG